MIKTLRLTSVAVVILATVVLASVLGFLRSDSSLSLRAGTGSGKQTENILKGPSAVERFKMQSGNKGQDSVDTTPPLIKQAELLAKIINPPEPVPDAGTKSPVGLPPKPKLPVKPLAQVSSKFNLLSTCCNSRASYAYIRLPDNTVQWVGVGEQIGHLTIKEIRKDSVICWDGNCEIPVDIEAIPETSSLLETGKAPSVVSATKVEEAAARPEPTGRTAPAQPVKASSAKSSSMSKPPSSVAKAAIVSSQPAMPATPAPSGQITKQEQEKLNRLGDRLKNDAGTDSAGQVEAANRLINDFKSSTKSLPPGVKELGDTVETDPGPEPLKKTLREENQRRYHSGRLTPPRAAKE